MLRDDAGKIQVPHRVDGHLPGALTTQTTNGRVFVGRQGRTNESTPDLLGNLLWISLHGVPVPVREMPSSPE